VVCILGSLIGQELSVETVAADGIIYFADLVCTGVCRSVLRESGESVCGVPGKFSPSCSVSSHSE
jgi:hypothetical protein